MQPVGTLTIDGDRAHVPSTIFDHAGFRAWARSGAVPENVRIAFVDGEVLIEKSPEATETHNKAKLKITEVLARLVDADDLGEAYADGTLLTNDEASLSTEPDFLFVSWATFESGRMRLVEKSRRQDDYVELEGSPDLVVEIVSDASVRKDTELLRVAYLRAGVQEYWLIDARGDDVSFRILQLRAGVYQAQRRHACVRLASRLAVRWVRGAAGQRRVGASCRGPRSALPILR